MHRLDCTAPPPAERDTPHALGTTACPPVIWDSRKRAAITEGTTPEELHHICLPTANGRITFLSPTFWKESVATQYMHKLARLILIYLDIFLPLLISSSLKLLVWCLLVFFVLKQGARKSNQNDV